MHVRSLQDHLTIALPNLVGGWVARQSGYEADICALLGMRADHGRYWDAQWGLHLLEFKKGTSIWLDLVRYSEVLLRLYDDACKDVHTLFFVPNSQRTQIVEVVCVKSSALIDFIKLTHDDAVMLIQLSQRVPRSLNAQASLTLRDVRNIKLFSVS